MAKDKKIYKKPKEKEKIEKRGERKRKGRGEEKQAGISYRCNPPPLFPKDTR